MTALPDHEPAGSRPSLARRASLGLGATLGSLLLAELALRVLGIAPPRFGETRHLESEDKRVGLDLYPSDEHDRFPLELSSEAARAPLRAHLPELDAWAERAPHAVPGYYSPELCRVASEGATLPDVSAERARVVLVGDSFIEGQGVVFEDTAARVLARALGERSEVLDCGRRGYDFAMDPSTGLADWTRRHVLGARVVVYAMTLNDAARSEAFQARQQYIDDWIVDRRRMLAAGGEAVSPWSPRLFALLDDRLEGLRIGRATMAWYREMYGAPNAAGWGATLDALDALDSTLAAEGRVLVIALWPLLASLEHAYPFEETHATIARALAERQLRFVDALPAFRGRETRALWVHEVDHHPNAEAHRLFAEALEPAVRDALTQSAADQP